MESLIPLIPPGLFLIINWYTWMVYIAFLIGAIVCVWISYDASRKGLEAAMPQAVGIVSSILMLPSLIIAIFPTIIFESPHLIVPMGYLGVIGGVGAIFAGLAYGLGWGVGAPVPLPLPSTRRTPQAESLPSPTARPRVRPTERTRLVGEQVAPVAWLVPKTGSRTGQQLGLSRGANTIGRSLRCNLVVEDGTVSGEHARIQFENGQFVIYDLASLNGTYVNKQRVQRQLLMDGDEIRLGESIFIFKKA